MTSVKSWGNYPDFPQSSFPVLWQDSLQATQAVAIDTQGHTLAIGQARSYGDSCLAVSNRVLEMRPLRRFVSADWETGQIVAEAGVTLEELLRVCLPRGWFVPVTPGTRFATLGGCVANDVHGKNHHVRGTFGHHVLSFGLQRSDRGYQECSLATHPELFAATIGGLGLTGVLLWVKVQLMPVSSSTLTVKQQRFANLDEFFALSTQLDHEHEYAVAWVDCLAKGEALGRGVYLAANHATTEFAAPTFTLKKPREFPAFPSFSWVNAPSVKLFNGAYWHKYSKTLTEVSQGISEYFYPLDHIAHWNRMYGKRGFQQYQCVIPESVAPVVIREILKSISDFGQASFLAVLKRCGDAASPGMLSFPMRGTSLALDFPQSGALDAQLFPWLDRLVHESGGRLYPAKDAHMSGESFRLAYPEWQQVERLRDPQLLSRFWQRMLPES